MQKQMINYNDKDYKIQPVETGEGVVLFKVSELKAATRGWDLVLMYGWLDQKLVQLTPRSKDNQELLELFDEQIPRLFQLRKAVRR